MERFFQITAVILAGVAAYFLWAGNKDGVFVTAVFAAVAFFLSIRFQVKERIKRREVENGEFDRWDEEEEFSGSPPLLEDSPAGAQFDDRQNSTDDRRRAAKKDRI
jgi:hypothetical protein